MHRLRTETSLLAREEADIGAEARRHLKVLRPKDGEKVELFDGNGKSREYRYVASTGALKASGPVVERVRPDGRITLFACVTKGSRWDWTIEKATELGVGRIVPVISERTIVRLDKKERAAKRERWERVAEDAARQCGTPWLPEIVEPLDFADAVELAKKTVCFAGILSDPPPRPMLAVFAEKAGEGGEYSVFIGPEGDFTPEEAAALSGFATPVSLGELVLRAETAAICAVGLMTATLYAKKCFRK